MEFRERGASVASVVVVGSDVVAVVVDLPESVVENLGNLGNFGLKPEDGSGVVVMISGIEKS
jgi:hypothetical protein